MSFLEPLGGTSKIPSAYEVTNGKISLKQDVYQKVAETSASEFTELLNKRVDPNQGSLTDISELILFCEPLAGMIFSMGRTGNEEIISHAKRMLEGIMKVLQNKPKDRQEIVTSALLSSFPTTHDSWDCFDWFIEMAHRYSITLNFALCSQINDIYVVLNQSNKEQVRFGKTVDLMML